MYLRFKGQGFEIIELAATARVSVSFSRGLPSRFFSGIDNPTVAA